MTLGRRTALVLSGGGVRGAYEVGVVAGIVEVLGVSRTDPAPFGTFVGSSVGAINAAYLAASADRGDLDVTGLIELWRSLRVDVHARLNVRLPWRSSRAGTSARRAAPPNGGAVRSHGRGWSLLDPEPLERLVDDHIAWSALHANVKRGTVHALIVPALEVAHGRTTMFAELGPAASFHPSRDPQRAARCGPIARDHVLASAAIPLLFPARPIDGALYYDGGLRFNTPLAPAIRVGAERLVVVTMLRADRVAPCCDPGIAFLAGKMFNALLADPIVYDLAVLERFNRLLNVLETSLPADELERVQRTIVELRGERYRRLDTLVFRPSRDIGVMAGEHVRRVGFGPGKLGWLVRRLFRRSANVEADWASYVLFDGAFAAELIELGRADAHARAGDIRTFFAA